MFNQRQEKTPLVVKELNIIMEQWWCNTHRRKPK